MSQAAALSHLMDAGIVGILPLGLKFIVDAFIGNYWIVLLSRLAFTAGFVLLTLSTPSVLSWESGLSFLTVDSPPPESEPFKRPQSDDSEENNRAGFFCSYQPQPRAERSLVKHILKRKHARSILFLVPISITFILLGVVSSIGNTFFIEQAVDMNHYVGSLWVPLLILPIFQHSYKKKKPLNCGIHPKLGIAFSMICAILSCITAAKVETRRLGVVTSQGVIDEPEKIIPMTMFWLLPQFALLGVSEAISEKNITDFFTNELALERNDDEATKASKRKHMEFLAQALSGVGMICGLVLVYIVRKATAANGGTSWFQNTLNTSRLDNYYWTLATLSAANLVFFLVVISVHHICSESRSVEDEQRSSSTVPLIA
ncbi:hypothetical protein ACLB2K_056844 [Fragaria x ananassa]